MKLPTGLLFEWPSRHNVHIALPFMLILALLLHVAGIAAFQILPPRARPNPERNAQAWFLSPSSPDYARLLPMLEASDPALFSPGRAAGRDVWKLPETTYVPSFDANRPTLAPLPAETGTAAILPPLPTQGPTTTFRATARHAPVSGLATMVKLGGPLHGWTLMPPATGPASFFAQQNKALAPTEFLIAIAPDGSPLHVFPNPDKTSGDEALDRAALRHLLSARYLPPQGDGMEKPDATSWGTATFLWGVDVTREPAP